LSSFFISFHPASQPSTHPSINSPPSTVSVDMLHPSAHGGGEHPNCTANRLSHGALLGADELALQVDLPAVGARFGWLMVPPPLSMEVEAWSVW